MNLNIAEFPIEKLIWVVSELLESIVHMNDTLVENTTLTRFHSREKPTISIYAYLVRILKFAPFTNEALLSLLVYFDRIAVKRHYAVNSLNVHRLLITSVVIASKYTSDIFYPTSRYAKVGGLPLLELNQLELEFLFLCDFHLYVSMEDLQDYANQLLQHHTTNNALIAPLASPPLNQHSPRFTPIPTKTEAVVTTTLTAMTTKSLADFHHANQSGLITLKTTTAETTTTIPTHLDTWMRKKRKAYSPSSLPLVQKRFCPSFSYSACGSRSIAMNSLSTRPPI